MLPLPSLSLDRFNQQILACQDDAFILAVSILGNEAAACEMVQKIILRVYTQPPR